MNANFPKGYDDAYYSEAQPAAIALYGSRRDGPVLKDSRTGCVHLVVSMEDEQNVQCADKDGMRFVRDPGGFRRRWERVTYVRDGRAGKGT
jgi:hypothetical protein